MSPDQETAADHEEQESEMQRNNEVRQEAISHSAILRMTTRAVSFGRVVDGTTKSICCPQRVRDSEAEGHSSCECNDQE
jgi:hypothetical protein